MRVFRCLLLSSTVFLLTALFAGTSYRVLKSIPLGPSDDTWDFQTIDDSARRMYVSHFSEVIVLDIDSGKIVGTIPDTPGVHGVAVAANVGKGFVSVGKRSSAVIFDLRDLHKIQEVSVGANPDAIIYDSASGRVFSFNGDSNDATAIESATGKVAGTVPIGGKPEFAIADGKGHVYVDLVDKNAILPINSQTLTSERPWPTAPCDRPTSMAADLASQRLFVGCRNLMLAVFDLNTGRYITQSPIGDNVDTSSFDPDSKLIFSSTGDGWVTITHEDTPDTYTLVEKIPTHDLSKTMALDPKTHKLFVPAGDVKWLPPAQPGGRPVKRIAPGTFRMLVIGK
ncbi:MAG TPA: hypothetical protein VNX88_16485 [Terriglobales bacterium]|jgi:DNA-binding beta-propeller fold protein YncE|nr:hypothetical protein [Terriglobales bacterium]